MTSTDGHPQPAASQVLNNFPRSQHCPVVVHVGLRLPTITGIQKPRWNFRKADWVSFSATLERSIPCITVIKIPVEQACSRFCTAIRKAAVASIPRGFRPAYIPALNSECSELLKQYEESNDSAIAEQLIECLDTARLQRWEESMTKLDFTRSSRKSWALVRRLGEALQPPKLCHAPVRANAVAAHLVQVGKASSDRVFERRVRSEWRSYRRSNKFCSLPSPFQPSEIGSAIQQLKSGTAPGYDNIHPEFLIHP